MHALRVALLAALVVAAPAAALAATPDWKISAEPVKKIMANHPADLRITVSDAAGKPVTGAAVELVTTMIDMDHGEHKSPAKVTAPGVYEGKVNFFMVGSWNLDVRVSKGAQAKAQKVRFDIKE